MAAPRRRSRGPRSGRGADAPERRVERTKKASQRPKAPRKAPPPSPKPPKTPARAVAPSEGSQRMRAEARRRADAQWVPIEANLLRGGIPKRDRMEARRYFDRNIAKASTEPRPAPPSRRFKDNETYRTHRGYYFFGADGRWRSPDGARWAPAKVAAKHNRAHHAKLVRQDAYYGLLARGAPVRKKDFDAAVKKVPSRKKAEGAQGGRAVRESIAQRVRSAKLIEKSLARAHQERERDERRFESEEIPRHSPSEAPERPADEERAHMASLGGDEDEEEGESSLDERYEIYRDEVRRGDDFTVGFTTEEAETLGFFDDFDALDLFDDWYDDYEQDGGDTP